MADRTESNVTASRASKYWIRFQPLRCAPGSVRGRTYVLHMPKGFHPRKQGDMGEMQAMAWLASIGAQVWIPIGHSPDVDVIAELDGPAPPGPGEELELSEGRALRSRPLHEWRQPELDWRGQALRPRPMRLPVRLVDRWSEVVHPLNGSRRQARHKPRRAEVLGVRDPGRRRGPRSVGGPPTMPVPVGGSAAVGEAGGPVKFVPSAEWVRIPPPPSKNGSRHLQGVRSKPTGASDDLPRPSDHDSDRSIHGCRLESRRPLRGRGGTKPGCVRLERIHAAGPQTPLRRRAATAPAGGA